MDHYIIGTSSKFGIKYRKHRLAEYLLKQSDTGKVYWIHVEKVNFKRLMFLFIRSLVKGRLSSRIPELDERIVTIRINAINLDYAYLNTYGKLTLKHLTHQIQSNPNPKTLWYTRLFFPHLSRMSGWEAIIYDCSDLWIGFINHFSSRNLQVFWNSMKRKKGLRFIYKLIVNGTPVYYHYVKKKIIENWLTQAEKKITSRSTHLFCTTDYLAEHLFRISGRKAHVIENGVDEERFIDQSREIDPLAHIPKPRIGYVGSIKEMMDAPFYHQVIRSLSQYSFVFIGPLRGGSNFEVVFQEPNVYVTDRVSTSEVTRYMQALDVGVLPYRQIALTEACSPLKFFEYLAAGLPVVGRGLPTTEKYEEEGVYYYSGLTPEAYAANITRALAQSQNQEFQKRRRAIAKQQLWDDKFAEMLHIVRNDSRT